MPTHTHTYTHNPYMYRPLPVLPPLSGSSRQHFTAHTDFRRHRRRRQRDHLLLPLPPPSPITNQPSPPATATTPHRPHSHSPPPPLPDVALQEAAVEVVADGVVHEALLLLGLAARLVLEHHIVIPAACRTGCKGGVYIHNELRKW